MRERLTKPRLLVLALAMALVLASLACFAAKAQADEATTKASFSRRAPDAVLMKGDTAIQKGYRLSSCWSYWDEASGWWAASCGDVAYYTFPRAPAPLKAGTRLHIRLAKPERPDRFQIFAYKGFDKQTRRPTGKGRRLDTELSPVRRDDQTVAWDVSLRVNKPDRNYYLDVYSVWEDEMSEHVSGGDADYTFHVKTRP